LEETSKVLIEFFKQVFQSSSGTKFLYPVAHQIAS